MKTTPERVYILTDNGYEAISYQDFCNVRKADGQYMDSHWFIPIQGMLMEVTEADYHAFYKSWERVRYLKKLDQKEQLLSIDAFDTEDGNGVDYIPDKKENVADTAINRLMWDKLHDCLSALSEEEQTLIRQHYFEGISQVELSEKYGVNQSSISRKISKILLKLKKLMEN